MSDLRETSILILHDEGRVLIDTNVRGMASKLLRQGFREFTGKQSVPYRRFEGQERQVSLRGARKRVATGVGKGDRGKKGRKEGSREGKTS